MLLANERTLLAWVRTALALIGSGVVVGTATHIRPAWLHALIATFPIVLGAGASALGFARWRTNDRAFRGSGPAPTDRALRYVAILVGLSGLIAGIVVIARIVG